MNVVTPTLTPYLPEKSKARGTGVIVAPGGACVALAIDLEANEVAHWLQDKQGTTSDHWIDEFYYWLEAQGLTKPAK
jgi:hypothetical protein